ncbi:MAG TPA: hypothetical protein VK619_06215 [Pyrinomonadaceae bacterium]|nr:hypothetical protein [Pyrinomonadaceae bacterium]
MLKMRLSDAISPATASLAQRGYLGCLPFAHDERDEIVLRLLPERDLDDSPVAIAWWSVTEGMTIAPDLSRFVAGRLAQTDMADPDRKISDSTRARLIKFAAEFGDKSSTESLLDSVDEVRSIKDSSVRAGKLWEVACPDDPLCKALAGAWTHRRKEVGDWLKQAMREISDVEIVLRLYVTYHVIYQTGTDVTEEAWKLVAADDVFDPTYTGASYGPTKGAWLSEALTYAIRWLQEQKRLDPQRTQSELWKAAQAYEDSENYDGSEHLAAARKLATENPALAYTHAANAAAFYARETEKTPIEAIIFAHELALANDWKNLSTVLEWTRAEIGI